MKVSRRRFLCLAGSAAAASAVPHAAPAQTYPSRPVTLIVPFAPGGPTDAIGRLLAERMRPSLGQTVMVENATGAGGTIGVARGARAAPDGYTISLGHNGTHVATGATYSNLPYDLLKDFAAAEPYLHCALRHRRKENDAGKRSQPAHRMAESQSGYGDGGERRSGQRRACERPHISEAYRHTAWVRPLSRQRSGHAGPGGRPNRPDDFRSRYRRPADPCRQHQKLWSHLRRSSSLRARHSHGGRSGIARLPCCAVARPLDAGGHAKAHHRQAQYRSHGCLGRRGGAGEAGRARPGNLPARPPDPRGARRPAKG